MFEGTITALITPFKPEPADKPAIDFAALEGLVEWQIESGVSGFVVNGTTGESSTLDPQEKLEVLKRVIKVVNGRVTVIAGTGTNNTKTTIEMTRAAKELGAHGALVVNPYYNRPTQEGLFQHFSAVAAQGGLPVILYNIPGRTGVEIAIETFERLAQIKEIVAVKQAMDSATRIMEIVEKVGEKITLLSGEDGLTYLMLAAGGKGVISASANVIPKAMVAITNHFHDGNFEESLEAQLDAMPIIRALFAESNPAPAKAALAMLGRIGTDTMRLPLVPVAAGTRELLRKVLHVH